MTLKIHNKNIQNLKEFWDFSWDEMAKHDLPAMINYILKVTGQTQLIYVGHSQGTMLGFSAFSQDQELASKVKLFVALAPVAQLDHMKSPIRLLAEIGKPSTQQIWYNILGKKDFLPSCIPTFVLLFLTNKNLN